MTNSIEGAMPPLPEPTLHQFESKGIWYSFMDDKHYRNTVEDGRYVLREMFTAEQMHAYAAPLIARVAELEADAARMDAMQKHRIAVIPEFEGDWEASISTDGARRSRPLASAAPRAKQLTLP